MNIVITGASQGIGKAIAEKFAANGYSLFICSRNSANLSALAENLRSVYPAISVYERACDVSVKPDLQSFADWILQKNLPVDVLVNNAGLFIPGNVFNEEDGLLEEMMKVNVYSAYYLSRWLLPSMMERRNGHLFNICSIASLKAYENGGSYSITKHAMAGISANLRQEMMPYGIKVTSVFPGAAYTGSWSESDIDPERLMKAEDIAGMVYMAAQLSPQACVEEIVIRPQLGDL